MASGSLSPHRWSSSASSCSRTSTWLTQRPRGAVPAARAQRRETRRHPAPGRGHAGLYPHRRALPRAGQHTCPSLYRRRQDGRLDPQRALPRRGACDAARRRGSGSRRAKDCVHGGYHGHTARRARARLGVYARRRAGTRQRRYAHSPCQRRPGAQCGRQRTAGHGGSGRARHERQRAGRRDRWGVHSGARHGCAARRFDQFGGALWRPGPDAGAVSARHGAGLRHGYLGCGRRGRRGRTGQGHDSRPGGARRDPGRSRGRPGRGAGSSHRNAPRPAAARRRRRAARGGAGRPANGSCADSHGLHFAER